MITGIVIFICVKCYTIANVGHFKLVTCFKSYIRSSDLVVILYHGGGGNLVGVGGSVEPSKLNKIRHNNTLTWPQKAKIPISENPNLKNFPGEDAPGLLSRALPSTVSIPGTVSRTPFSKTQIKPVKPVCGGRKWCSTRGGKG